MAQGMVAQKLSPGQIGYIFQSVFSMWVCRSDTDRRAVWWEGECLQRYLVFGSLVQYLFLVHLMGIWCNFFLQKFGYRARTPSPSSRMKTPRAIIPNIYTPGDNFPCEYTRHHCVTIQFFQKPKFYELSDAATDIEDTCVFCSSPSQLISLFPSSLFLSYLND